MISIEWNEKMSVGIDEIDADHKKILSIVSSIIDAINTNGNDATIERYFSELTLCASAHFEQEEALMATLASDFVEHQQGHQAFLKQLPELKNKLLNSDDAEAAEEVSQFLYDWIIEHMLISDMDLLNVPHQKAAHSITLKSLFLRSSAWLTGNVKLSTRVLITALLPTVGLVLLSFNVIKDNYQQYQNMQQLQHLTQIVQKMNLLAYSIEVERGLLSSYISSDYKLYRKELNDQRSRSDNEISAFLTLLHSRKALSTQPMLIEFINSTDSDLAELNLFRRGLNDLEMINGQVLYDYNVIVAKLLSNVSRLSHIQSDAEFKNKITAIIAIVELKEIISWQRETGMLLIGNEQTQDELLRSDNYKLLYTQLGMQFHAAFVFNYSAIAIQKSACAELCNIQIQKSFMDNAVADFILSPQGQENSQLWFTHMTARINDIKIVTDNIIKELEVKTQLKLAEIEQRFYFVLILFSGILILNKLFVSAIYYSVVTPIRRVTHALKQIKLCHYNHKLKGSTSNDEIGAMYEAFETLRKKLLQADMSKKIIKSQQQSLLVRRKERDQYRELASRDTLTGALNRRKFNQILKKEITFAQQDNQPLSLLLLDIDYFKKVNDTYGHGGGDQVLRAFYDACFSSVKASDVVARVGGEEFAILMPETNSTQAHIIAERVRFNVSELQVAYEQQNIRITVSIGLVQWQESDAFNDEEFIAHADKALYQAKRDGRNRVVEASSILTNSNLTH